MARIRVSTTIDATPAQVWAAIEDIATHVEWMTDARSIRFRGSKRAGVGTVFECETRVGPLRTLDVMEITSWKPRRRMGVRHVGLVKGDGRFVIRARRRNRTTFTWRERLTFPWWLGGPVGATIGAELLRFVWRRNLGNLRRIVEG